MYMYMYMYVFVWSRPPATSHPSWGTTVHLAYLPMPCTIPYIYNIIYSDICSISIYMIYIWYIYILYHTLSLTLHIYIYVYIYTPLSWHTHPHPQGGRGSSLPLLLDQISLDEAIGLRRDFLSFAVRDFSSVVCFPGKNLKSSQVIRSFHNGLNHIKSTWDFF